MRKISRKAKASILYHSLFDYPLRKEEFTKWEVGRKGLDIFPSSIEVGYKDGFYFISGNESSVFLRRERGAFSRNKITLSRRFIACFSFLPTVKLIALTGSLAMLNSDSDSDIDLLIVTKSGFLWTTRFFVYILLIFFRIPFRKFGEGGIKDKLCLNVWLDESNLIWPDKNIFTAHEILQIVPLVNKHYTYEKFLSSNLWAFDFWPNAVDKDALVAKNFTKNCFKCRLLNFLVCFLWFPAELFFFLTQKFYMLGKKKKETVELKRAVFHPIDLSRFILEKIRNPRH